jgi:hypothetical protein
MSDEQRAALLKAAVEKIRESDEKRAALLMQAMEKLRDKNPAASSFWIRQQAEAFVEKKMGPKDPPPPLPDPRTEIEPIKEEEPKKKPALVIPTAGEGLQIFGWVLFGLGFFFWLLSSVAGNGATLVAGFLFLMWALLVGTGAICSHLRVNTMYVKRVYETLEASELSSGDDHE